MIHHTRIDHHSHKPKKNKTKKHMPPSPAHGDGRAGPCTWPRAAAAACWAAPAPRLRQRRCGSWPRATAAAGRLAGPHPGAPAPAGAWPRLAGPQPRALPAARRPAAAPAPTSVATPPGRTQRRRRLAGSPARARPHRRLGAARRPRLRLRGRKDRIEEGGEEESSRERDAREKKSRRDKRGDRVK